MNMGTKTEVIRESQRPTDAQRQDLLDDMRCKAVYSDKVTMPVPLYERIKAVLQATTVQQEVSDCILELKKWQTILPLEDFTPDEFRQWENRKHVLLENLWQALKKIPASDLKECNSQK